MNQTPVHVQAFFDWFSGQPVIAALLYLMVLDTIAGTFLALIKKTFNSTTSWRGACKKGIILLIIGGACIMQPLIPNWPILNMIGMYYTVTELISLLENAAAAGVPLPSGLIDTLSKLREQKVLLATQKGVTQNTNISVYSASPPEAKAVIIQEETKPKA